MAACPLLFSHCRKATLCYQRFSHTHTAHTANTADPADSTQPGPAGYGSAVCHGGPRPTVCCRGARRHGVQPSWLQWLPAKPEATLCAAVLHFAAAEERQQQLAAAAAATSSRRRRSRLLGKQQQLAAATSSSSRRAAASCLRRQHVDSSARAATAVANSSGSEGCGGLEPWSVGSWNGSCNGPFWSGPWGGWDNGPIGPWSGCDNPAMAGTMGPGMVATTGPAWKGPACGMAGTMGPAMAGTMGPGAAGAMGLLCRRCQQLFGTFQHSASWLCLACHSRGVCGSWRPLSSKQVSCCKHGQRCSFRVIKRQLPTISETSGAQPAAEQAAPARTKEEEDSKTDAGETKAESETKTIIPETHAKKKQCVVLLFLS